MAKGKDGTSASTRGVVLLYACSGASNVSEAAWRACRQLAREGLGRLACLSAVAADEPRALQAAREADLNVIVDGCENECGRKAFDRRGLGRRIHVRVTDLDIEKADGQAAEGEQVAVVVRRVRKELA